MSTETFIHRESRPEAAQPEHVVVEQPVVPIRFAKLKDVEKAHNRAIRLFSAMFRRLAE